MTEHVEKIHRAVARASLQTGAPIMAHSMPAVGDRSASGRDLRGGGRRPGARSRSRTAATRDDIDYIEGLLARGVYVGLDRYGLEMYLPIDKRNATAAELLRRGHAERLMISQDFCATIDWFPPEAAEMFETARARSATGR